MEEIKTKTTTIRRRAKKVDPVPSSIVETGIKITGSSPHVFEDLTKVDSEIPFTAVGMVKVPGARTYVSYTLTCLGKNIVKVEVGEPNLKLIVEDEAKISFVNNFMNSPND